MLAVQIADMDADGSNMKKNSHVKAGKLPHQDKSSLNFSSMSVSRLLSGSNPPRCLTFHKVAFTASLLLISLLRATSANSGDVREIDHQYVMLPHAVCDDILIQVRNKIMIPNRNHIRQVSEKVISLVS